MRPTRKRAGHMKRLCPAPPYFELAGAYAPELLTLVGAEADGGQCGRAGNVEMVGAVPGIVMLLVTVVTPPCRSVLMMVKVLLPGCNFARCIKRPLPSTFAALPLT